jgi:nucleotide-binding universal stress UspA family protein
MATEGERWVGLAVDFSEGSRAALKWAADNLLRTGDNLLLLHVLKDPNYEQGETLLWEATGSPLIPLSEFSDPSIAKKYGVKPDAETLDMLNTVARQKEVTVVSKVLFGDPREKLCQAIHDMPISCLVIGSRGLGKLKRVLLGSVSDYVVNNAACPVTVVKTETTHA